MRQVAKKKDIFAERLKYMEPVGSWSQDCTRWGIFSPERAALSNLVQGTLKPWSMGREVYSRCPACQGTRQVIGAETANKRSLAVPRELEKIELPVAGLLPNRFPSLAMANIVPTRT